MNFDMEKSDDRSIVNFHGRLTSGCLEGIRSILRLLMGQAGISLPVKSGWSLLIYPAINW